MGDEAPEGVYHLTTSVSQLYDVAWVGPWSSKEDVVEALVGLVPLLYHWAPVIRNKDTKGMTVFTGKISEEEIRRLIKERPS